MILASPMNFVANHPINKSEEKYFKLNNINTERLCKQHDELVKCLKENGVDCQFLVNDKKLPEQTFVRDTAFFVDDIIFVCNMKEKIRDKETKVVEKLFQGEEYKQYKLIKLKKQIEGGDVVVYGKNVFIGYNPNGNGRTSMGGDWRNKNISRGI